MIGDGPSADGTTVPVQQTAFGCAVFGVGHLPLVVGDRTFGVQVSRSGTFPWLRILRLPRFGRGLPPATLTAAVGRLRALADAGGVLRVHIEGWTEDPEDMARLSEACRSCGFREAPSARSYAHTIWVDLEPSEEEILLGFDTSARRNVRAPGKKGFVVAPVTDEAMAPMLEALHALAFSRTGGSPPRLDWQAAIRVARERPARVRIVGLSHAPAEGGTLLSFAMAFNHGDVAEHAFAGSARTPDVKIPLMYAPTWDLMGWAKQNGVRWFDFGGVPAPGATGDPRSGITAFKQYFSKNVVRVGAEWVYEPNPGMAKLASGVRNVVRRWLPLGR